MARYRHHMCLDLQGTIRNAKFMKGCITLDNGYTLQTVAEIRQWCKEQIAMGRKVVPCGDCDNFDYQKGCRGHLIEEDEQLTHQHEDKGE